MANLREGIVQLNIPIPEELRDLLDFEVIQRCGYPKRGILGEVVTEALREYLYKRHTHTNFEQQSKKKGNFQTNRFLRNKNKRERRYEELKMEITDYGTEHNYSIPDFKLREMIRQTFGNDIRTINKYFDLISNDLMLFPEANEKSYSTPKPLVNHNNNNNEMEKITII